MRQDEGSVAEANLAGVAGRVLGVVEKEDLTILRERPQHGDRLLQRRWAELGAAHAVSELRPTTVLHRPTLALDARVGLVVVVDGPLHVHTFGAEVVDELRARELRTRVETNRADGLVVNDTELVHDLVEHGLGGLRRHGRPRPLPRPTRVIVVGDGGVRVHAELVVHAFDSRTEGIESDATADLVSPRRRAVTVHDLVRLARRTTGARRGGRARAKVVRAVGLKRDVRWRVGWGSGRCEHGQRLRSGGAGESSRGGRDEGLHADVRKLGLLGEVRDDIRRGFRENGLRGDGGRNLAGDVLDELGGRAASVRDREDGNVVLDVAVAPQ